VGLNYYSTENLLLSTKNSRLRALRSCKFLLVAVIFALPACAPSIVVKKVPVPSAVSSVQQRFQKAEDLFQQQAYSKALAVYEEYLRQFPKGPMADTALMKIGTIYMAMGKNRQARQAFERLESEYPESPFVHDARLSVILTYYNEHDYGPAIASARAALKLATTVRQKSRIHCILGKIYGAGNQLEDAIQCYMAAYALAPQKTRTEIVSKVKGLIARMKESQLESLLKVYGNKVPGGYLRLQLAREYAAADRIEAAIKVLSDFIASFPDHDELKTATALMKELKSRLRVDRFLLGCILPLSGPYSSFGNRTLAGIELALHQFNAQPDVHPIELLIKDSKGDPGEATRAVESLTLTEGVIGIIGPMITSEAAATEAQMLKVPIITLTQKPDITRLGDYVFRDFLTLSLQVKAISDYAVSELGLKRFAILYPDERYGISFMNSFWDELTAHNAEVVGIESYSPDQTDFSDPIKKLVGLYYPRPEEEEEEEEEKVPPTLNEDEFESEVQQTDTLEPGETAAEEPAETLPEAPPEENELQESEQKEPEPIIDFDAIFIPDSFEKIGLIAPQLMYHDISNILLLGTNLWHSDKLIEMARAYVQGAVIPDGFFVNSPSVRVQNFVDSFIKTFGRAPGFLEAVAYDAAWIFFETVNQPEVWSRCTLKRALTQVKDFEGVTGLTSFGETGDVEKQIFLLKIEGGCFVQIRP